MQPIRESLCLGAALFVCLASLSSFAQSAPPGQMASHHVTTVADARASNAKSTSNYLVSATKLAAKASDGPAALLSVDSVQNLPDCGESNHAAYGYNGWLPLKGCSEDATLKFFNVSGAASVGNQGQYLYNARQSTNQIRADLFTGTFYPGFQAVLAGTATPAASQSPQTQTSGQAGGAVSPTDSVQTAVSKLEQGGDFNLRFPTPIAYRAFNRSTGLITFVPNVGFTVNGLTGQNTVTDSSQYSINIPLEFYLETGSYETDSKGLSNAVMYFDAKPGVDVISPALKSAIGLTSNRYFFLGQVSAGIQFSQSIRVGFQYFIGPSQIYTVPTASGGSSTKVSNLGGLHLVVSFTNPASTNPKKSGS
jgi:hypothetical protein